MASRVQPGKQTQRFYSDTPFSVAVSSGKNDFGWSNFIIVKWHSKYGA